MEGFKQKGNEIEVPKEKLSLSEAEVEKLIEFRRHQRYADRLIEYITGHRMDDVQSIERLMDRLRKDQPIVVKKYNLPDRSLLTTSLTQFETKLRDLAKKLNIIIKQRVEAGSFFIEYPHAGGVYLSPSHALAVDVVRDTPTSYEKSLEGLEHELIHAFQHQKYPRMPIELMEYEAYVATTKLEESSSIWSFCESLSHSVHYGYAQRGSTPEWDNAQYFLEKVDRIYEG